MHVLLGKRYPAPYSIRVPEVGHGQERGKYKTRKCPNNNKSDPKYARIGGNLEGHHRYDSGDYDGQRGKGERKAKTIMRKTAGGS